MSAAVLIASAASMSSAPGAVRSYTGPDGGAWGVDANWSGGSFPVGGDDANIGNVNTFATPNLAVTYNVANFASLGTLTIDSTALSGTATLNETLTGGVVLGANVEYVGKTVVFNAHNQSTGTNNIGLLYIGYGLGASGNYNLSAGGSLTVNTSHVGESGLGTFTQSGGTHQTTTTIYVGHDSTSSGSYSLSGGTASATDIVIGLMFGSSGTFNVTGGSLSTSGGGSIFVGQGGSASFAISGGGSVSVGALLDVAGSAGSTGTMTLASGGALSVNGQEIVGDLGNGNVTQTGGTHAVGGNLTISNFPGNSHASFNLLGGSLNVVGNVALNTGGNFNGGGSATLKAATFTQSGGSVSGTLQNQGSYIYNSGTFNGRLINQGTVTFNANFSALNGMENDSIVNVFTGPTITLSGAGLDNQGTINLLGGTLNLSTTTTNTSSGNFNLSSSTPYNLNGASLANGGTLNLNGSLLTGAGTLTNTFGGVIRGSGIISSIFANAGGIVLVESGTTRITSTFSNTGVIQLGGVAANLTGGAITNTANIQGFGSIANNINNNSGGSIEALGGTLIIGGTVHNSPGALLAASTGSKLLISAGLPPNAGTINLTGGTFDNNGIDLTNSGSMSGWGTFRAPNINNGSTLTGVGGVTLTGGTTTIQGNVNNLSGSSIKVLYNPAIISGNLVNNGSVKTTGTTLTVVGTYSGSGSYVSDPSDNYFLSPATIDGGGSMSGAAGDRFFMQDTFANNGTFANGGQLNAGAVSTTGSFTQTGTLNVRAASSMSSSGTTTIGGVQNWGSGTTLAVSAGVTTLNSDAGNPSSKTLSLNASGVGAVNLNATQHLASLSAGGSANVTLAAGGSRVIVATALATSGSGRVDLMDNKLITRTPVGTWTGSSYGGVTGMIESGINLGGTLWAGPGLTTSLGGNGASGFTALGVMLNDYASIGLPSGPIYTSFGGETVGANDVLVKYTYFGDADLSGSVTSNDYFQIDVGFLASRRGWINGDFDYDGNVTSNDYFLIDRAFLGQQGGIAAPGGAAIAGSMTLVPEPAGMMLLIAAMWGSRGRRRRG